MVAETEWIRTPQFPPDQGGPTERAFRRMSGPQTMVPLHDALGAVAKGQLHLAATETQDGSTRTFEALTCEIDRLAERIAEIPAGPVGVMTAGAPSDVEAIFACLAVGRIAVLLDGAAPEARNLELLREMRATAVVGPDSVTAPSGGSQLTVRPTHLGGGGARTPRSRLGLDEPAFIMATSGSTGRPKLIAHSQRTMFHWVRTLNNAMHLSSDDRVLSLSSTSTLGGFTALLSVPLAGGCLQMLDLKSAGLSGLVDTLRRRPVTILRAAPSMLRTLARLPDASTAFSGLRLVQTYGEALTAEDVNALRRVLSSECLIRTTYGSTECSGLSWYAEVAGRDARSRLPTGALMPDTEARILDEKGAACAPGEAGELVIRSAYNALGEWENGGLVAGRLPADPQSASQRIYHTGDLATFDAGGLFTVLGRKDRMMKINGQRLEPAEIERVLRADPDVARAEVAVEPSAAAVQVLAFVVAAVGAPPGLVERLNRRLRAELPSYMTPSRILITDAIPLLASGKVDVVALIASTKRASGAVALTTT